MNNTGVFTLVTLLAIVNALLCIPALSLKIIDVRGLQKQQGISFTTFPTSINDGEDVVVNWSGIQDASATDMVTVSCGPLNPELGLSDYVFSQTAKNTNGSGSVRFANLVMIRCTYVFNYVQQNDTHMVVLASANVTMRDSFNAPKQGRLALTDQDTEMAVVYISGSRDVAPSVRFGTSPQQYTSTVTGASKTYNASDMCQLPATKFAQAYFRDPGFIHVVILTGLAHSTMYFYQYGNDVDGWSEERSFLSRPEKSTEETVKFLAFADMGIDSSPAATSTSIMALQDVVNGYNHFLLHFGDISYARGKAWTWDSFGTLIEPVASRVPYMVSVGNHEYDHLMGGENDPSHAPGNGWHPIWGNMGDDSSGECGVPTFYRFTSPQNGNGIFWYSFNYGSVHVIQMSSEHDWTRGSEQYNWIKQDLAAVNRTETPWVVVTSHRMMYTTQLKEDADYIVSEFFKAEFDDLLYENQVNLFLCGHQHSYERSCPVYNRTCQENFNGTVHIIVGSAGAGLEQGGFSSKLGDWSLVQISDWGYCRVVATQETLHVEFVLNRSGEIYDEVDIYPWGTSPSQY